MLNLVNTYSKKIYFEEFFQQMLEAEMNEHLGYPKCNYENKNTTNSRMVKAKNYEIRFKSI